MEATDGVELTIPIMGQSRKGCFLPAYWLLVALFFLPWYLNMLCLSLLTMDPSFSTIWYHTNNTETELKNHSFTIKEGVEYRLKVLFR